MSGRMRLLFALAALAIGIGDAGAREWTTVRIGTEGTYKPFNFMGPDGQLQGFDVDIARALCSRMAVECRFAVQDWDGIIEGLLARKYDAIIASMAITEERKRKVAFTEKYYETPRRFVARKGSGITQTDPNSLMGRTLGAQSSTTNGSYLEDKYATKGADLRLYGTLDEANSDLAAGRLDAVLAGTIAILDWLQSSEGQCCEFVGPEIKDPLYFGAGAGIAIRKEDHELKAMFERALNEIRADGTYDKINAKYFPFSIY